MENKTTCKICSKEFGHIRLHVKKYHSLDFNTYCEQYDNSLLPKCIECNTTMKFGKNLSKWCSVECKKSYKLKEIVQRSKEKYKDDIDVVECQICGLVGKSFGEHFARRHNISIQEYKEQFPDAKVVSDSYFQKLSDLNSGENNPGYQHGGRLSAYSDKFKKYNNLSEEEIAKKKDEVIQKCKDAKLENDSDTTKLSYYTSRGLTEEDAKIALKERQTTFSLEICIEKYGEEKGRQKWLDRQEKWHKNYKKSNFSKISQELYWEIANIFGHLDEITFATLNKGDIDDSGKNNEARLRLEKVILPDFLYKDKIIECDGDYWHGESRGNQERDKTRNKILTDNGYEVLHIKERDYKEDKQGTIQKCLNFLRN